MKLLGFCWPHEWKFCRRRFGFVDDTGKTVGTARKVCIRCAKTVFLWERHLPSPSLDSIIKSRDRIGVLQILASRLFGID